MSTHTFPTPTELPGITYDVEREMIWRNNVQEAISGKETRIAYWNAARYRWALTYSFLRSGSDAELQKLWGFVSARQGSFDSFLYLDSDDYQVTGQSLGLGTGAATAFPLLRTFGTNGTPEPMLAPKTVTAVYINSVVQSATSYSVSTWGSAVPGVVTFNSAPGNGSAISVDFSYYFPCRFDDGDNSSFTNFARQFWEMKKITFKSIK